MLSPGLSRTAMQATPDHARPLLTEHPAYGREAALIGRTAIAVPVLPALLTSKAHPP